MFFKSKLLCSSHTGSLVQLIIDVFVDSLRSMVQAAFLTGPAVCQQQGRATQACLSAHTGWEDRALLKPATKGDLFQVEEVLHNSLHRPQAAHPQAGLSAHSLERERQEPELHTAKFGHAFKPGFLLGLSEWSKSA